MTGTIVTAAGGIYYGLIRRFGPHASKLFLGALLGFVIVFLAGIYIWHQNRRAERISQIAMYLRCDISAHNYAIERYKARDRQALSMWREYGNFKRVAMNQVRALLRKQPDATLVATDERVIRHYSGIPAVKFRGKLNPFAHIRSMELPRRLAKVRSKDLYLTDFNYINRLPAFYKADKSVFKKFDNIYTPIERKLMLLS